MQVQSKFLAGTSKRRLAAALAISCALPALAGAAESILDVTRTARGGYELYEPAALAIALNRAPPPVVVYLHGAFGNDPELYDPMLRDLARAGCVVVFPRYDGLVSQWYPDAVAKTRGALNDLRAGLPNPLTGRTYFPDAERVALVGHSAGGMYSLKLAHEASQLGLPQPRAIVLHDGAGFNWLPFLRPQGADLEWLDSLHRTPSHARLVLLVAEDTWYWETLVEHQDGDEVMLGNSSGSGIWARAWHNTGLPSDRKRVFLVPGGHNGMRGDDGYAVYEHYRALTIEALQSAWSGGGLPASRDGVTRIDGLIQWFVRPLPWSGF